MAIKISNIINGFHKMRKNIQFIRVIVLVAIAVCLYSCKMLQYTGSYYYEYIYNFSYNTVDSACKIFSKRVLEYQIPDSIVLDAINKSTDSIYRRKMKTLQITKVYYPYEPSIMKPYYVCWSARMQCYYIYTVADRGNYSILILDWIKKGTWHSKALFPKDLNDWEINRFKNDFISIVISNIDSILIEMKCKALSEQ